MVAERLAALRKECKGCGIVFYPKTKKQKYHNEDCRKAYYKRTYFAQEVVEKTCPNCGSVFKTAMPKKQAYCTPECREENQAKREEALRASRSAEKVTYFRERMGAFRDSEYKCTVCGRGPEDGAVLDVVEEDAVLKTVCTDCKTGQKEVP